MAEGTKEQYNQKYKNGENMYNRYENYKQMGLPIIQNIYPEQGVADFGCGTGLFAKCAIINNVKYSYGVDFSEEAIKIAGNINPLNEFIIGDLYNKDIYNYKCYDVALFLDVLEHLKDDKKCLSFVPSGKIVIMALPNFGSPDHVRVFQGKESLKRYDDLIDVQDIDKGKNIHILYGIKK